MSNKPLLGWIGNISENVIIREEVKCRVFSSGKPADAAGTLFSVLRQCRPLAEILCTHI